MYKAKNPTILKIMKLIHLIATIMCCGGYIVSFFVSIISPEAPLDAMFTKCLFLPGCVLLLIGGIAYGLFTNFGFFKSAWLRLKWFLIILFPLCGNLLPHTLWSGIFNLFIMLIILILSVFKPRTLRY